MELEELKNSWVALDNRLKKNEALTEALIIKMTENKAKRSINKLLFGEIVGIPILLFAIPFLIDRYCKWGGKAIFWDILMISVIVVCSVVLFWQIYKTYILMKNDFSNKISDNICNTNKYKILINQEKIVFVVVMSILGLLAILAYVEAKVNIYLWIFLASMMSFVLLVARWSYNKFYKKNINSILESLNEIKEIEEKD